VLWTAAHHRIPLLSVMHNNRAYHEELMHVQRLANRHNRGIDRAGIGTTFGDPVMDDAKLAQSVGVYAEGPITEPSELAPEIKRALAVVKSGQASTSVDNHTHELSSGGAESDGIGLLLVCSSMHGVIVGVNRAGQH
jgi:thiamine pyrophosphate-dependent acetolactate synthase large subunit-like protein